MEYWNKVKAFFDTPASNMVGICIEIALVGTNLVNFTYLVFMGVFSLSLKVFSIGNVGYGKQTTTSCDLCSRRLCTVKHCKCICTTMVIVW